MTSKRLPDWRPRLAAYFDDVERLPYDEASHNCGLFPAGAVEAMTGQDVARKYRAASIATMLRRLKKDGFDTHIDFVASIFPEIHPSQAVAGDLIAFKVVDDDIGWALGVSIGERAKLLRPDGLGTLSTLSGKRAFRV